eukprot:GHRQ01023862.1.p3 GENE.GHRQ01023862.1~~GHRQ01023862.1.p3  ORF type:complete len:103 (+),score=15.17 GHRQ01023862.1:801-1109(+)
MQVRTHGLDGVLRCLRGAAARAYIQAELWHVPISKLSCGTPTAHDAVNATDSQRAVAWVLSLKPSSPFPPMRMQLITNRMPYTPQLSTKRDALLPATKICAA